GAVEALSVGREIKRSFAGPERLEGEVEPALGHGPADLRYATQSEMALDLGAGLLEFHQPKVSEPEPLEVGRFRCFGRGGYQAHHEANSRDCTRAPSHGRPPI